MLSSSSPPPLSFSLHSPFQRFSFPAIPTRRPHPPLLSFAAHSSSSTSFPYSLPNRQPIPKTNPHQGKDDDDDDEEEDYYDDGTVIGDCLVFEEGAFEDAAPSRPTRRRGSGPAPPEPESLVPDKWKEAVDEIRMTKKDKRKIAHQLRFGSKLERRKKSPTRDMEEYKAYRDLKLSQLKPVVLDKPKNLPPSPPEEAEEEAAAGSKEWEVVSVGRVAPRNPRLGLAGGSLEDISDLFHSGRYVPGELEDDKKPRAGRKLFTKEEKALLNKRIPNLLEATSSKWLPLHTLAASGEFYLLDTILKHSVDINVVDKDGLLAIHKAVLCKKQAIINYLLRNSANPFVRDPDGATLIHYAVQTASSQTIKILLLYNVDINLADNDGWTPLHLAVQTQRTDIVKLLLIKGADRDLRNRDGLKPLDLCLYLGHDYRTYELIKLLKGLPMPKSVS
ncbi:putative ankyrin repeat domain-containing protein, chloroplastic [Iris pallida]|uniref:Ankyrin repeat domain-containing protein, chloroplastic n=1 Tax=Iris pallida TaxID=29817 RepID=A0AAX6G6H3_IRIPA|nr:putative ankyrin repeat domain-containing protein, chloroplastic [Iris pallida]